MLYAIYSMDLYQDLSITSKKALLSINTLLPFVNFFAL